MSKLIVFLFIKLINLYKQLISPILSRKIKCKFHPTCSEYARLALEKHGVRNGLSKTIKRLKKCNPNNLDSCIDNP